MAKSRHFDFLLNFAFLILLGIFTPATASAQEISRQETLRGSITPERAWWDLQHYHLTLSVNPASKTIDGNNIIAFNVLQPSKKMQIDLQEPLKISKILWKQNELEFEREGNVFWVTFPEKLAKDSEHQIQVFYGGKPVISRRPPWSGGFTWRKDEKGFDFIATSCQGDGASIWWPCKDHGYDEPDNGVNISVTVPENLVAVSNGRLKSTEKNPEKKTRTFHWAVTQPINNYCVNVNIGNYSNFKETLQGEAGELELDYWVLDHQRRTAEKHFREVPRTIKAFEHWFGKYPFYEDSYKLVVVPYLGMEHQSSVTYGNGFRNGYRGTDLSGTGVGMKFDFIIVHESGHEWFGNNISMKDVADMWIHESFTNYSENLFVEYHFSKEEAERYVIGCRKRVNNDRPIIGTYNANREGSGDMYYKGGNMIHTIRHIIDDDKKWRAILRGLNKDFYHSIVTTEQIENYISKKSGFDFSKYFDQYLRTVMIPKLEYELDGTDVRCKFTNVVKGFEIPVKVLINGQPQRVTIGEKTTTILNNTPVESFDVDRNFYIDVSRIDVSKG